jgi:hypothetical protein
MWLPQKMQLGNLLVQHIEQDIHSERWRSKVNSPPDACAAHQQGHRHKLYCTEA